MDYRHLIPSQIKDRFTFFIAYVCLMVALAEIGAALSRVNLGFSTLWPPSGLFISALVFSNNKTSDWRDVFLASAIANLVTDTIFHGSNLGITLCFIATNSASAFPAALIARRFISKTQTLNRLNEMLIFLSCGFLIQSPIAATIGLWLQSIFFDQEFTILRWFTWWSSNALGISCFGILSFSLLKWLSMVLTSGVRKEKELLAKRVMFDGRPGEFAAIWLMLLFSFVKVQSNFTAPVGLFVNNFLLFVMAYRFGIMHSNFALAMVCILRLTHAWESWIHMVPFMSAVLPFSNLNRLDSELVIIASVQTYLIERGVLVNLAAALFADLNRKQSELQDASDSRARLLARMSHEIRTPLGGMLGMVEAWAMKQNSSKHSQDLQMVLNSAEQLKRVIDDVLDFSKLSAGKMRVEVVRCNVRELFHELVSLHSGDADKKGLSLELKISDQFPDIIEIDPLRLRQIVNNLLANAIKFTRQGWVRMNVEDKYSWDSVPQMLRIEVEDSGIGISETSLQSLFQPFEQAGNETTRAYGGTGLGLAICRELCDLLGGKISVSSTRGVGTRFVVEIPYAPSDEVIEHQRESFLKTEDAPKFATAQDKGISVLVVEDDPINQIVATRFLEAEGYEVIAVDNGSRALELLQDQPGKFALVLMDYFMPKMDGCEVTRRFRASEREFGEFKHLPIVGLTASILDSDHQRCREAGMDDVLLKPLERKNLRALLNKYLAA